MTFKKLVILRIHGVSNPQVLLVPPLGDPRTGMPSCSPGFHPGATTVTPGLGQQPPAWSLPCPGPAPVTLRVRPHLWLLPHSGTVHADSGPALWLHPAPGPSACSCLKASPWPFLPAGACSPHLPHTPTLRSGICPSVTGSHGPGSPPAFLPFEMVQSHGPFFCRPNL